MLFALGLGPGIVAVTHECDYPPPARARPARGGVLGDFRRRAGAAEAPGAGERRPAEAAARIARVQDAVAGADRPRVAALEWLDPPYVGGHWVPQMIELAGGEDPLGFPGEKSRVATWEEIAAAEPEIVVSMPCGYDAERAARETDDYAERLDALGARA